MTQTSEERREVAERLRKQLRHMRENNCYSEDLNVADCGNSVYRNIAWSVEPYGNFEKGNYVHIVERLADLMDTTCHNQHPRASDGCFCCSECLFLYEPTDCRNGFLYCPRCGARVIRGGED